MEKKYPGVIFVIGARTRLRGKDFQEGFICASPSPICCVPGKLLL